LRQRGVQASRPDAIVAPASRHDLNHANAPVLATALSSTPLAPDYSFGDDPMTGSVPFRWASPGKWSGLGASEIGEAREYTADRRETVFVCVVCPTAFGVGRDVFHALDMFAGISQRAVCERCYRSA
jgi:hypothetical protein